jgi:hypothetical protein
MAIAFSNLTEGGSTTDGTTFVTGTNLSFLANQLYLAAIANNGPSTVAAATLTSEAGITWVQISTITFNTIASATERVSIFRAMPTSNISSTITVTYGATETNCLWNIATATGTDTTGTNGSGAVVQSSNSRSDGAVTYQTTLAAFGDAVNNACYFMCAQNSGDPITLKTGHVSLGNQNFSTPSTRLRSSWTLGQDLTPNATGNSHPYGAVAVEIKVASATGPSWANKLKRASKAESLLGG